MILNTDIYETFPVSQNAADIDLRMMALKLNDEGKLNDEVWDFIKVLSSRLSESVDQVESLEHYNDEKTEELEYQVDDLTTEKNKLEVKMINLEDEIKELKTEVESLKSQIPQ